MIKNDRNIFVIYKKKKSKIPIACLADPHFWDKNLPKFSLNFTKFSRNCSKFVEIARNKHRVFSFSTSFKSCRLNISANKISECD